MNRKRIHLSALLLALALLLPLLPGRAEAVGERRTITISAVGDCTLGRAHQMDYYQSFDYVFDKKGSDYFLRDVREIFLQDDLTLANLGRVDRKRYCHLGRPEFLRALTRGGVDLLSFANNHNIDYGLQGFRDTVAACAAEGVPLAYYDTVARVDCQGLTVGVVSVDLTYSAAETAEAYLRAGLADLKRDCDLIVAFLHWGQNYKTEPGQEQIRFGHLCVELGADLVFGCHAHVLQGVERYKGRYIFYSLGNFCYGGRLIPKDADTVIAQQSFTFLDGELQRDDAVRLIPCAMSSRADLNDYRPTVQTGKEARRILRKISARSELFGLAFDADGRPVIGPAEDAALPPPPVAAEPLVPEEIPAILYTLLELGEGDAPGDRGEGASIERTPQNPKIKKP